MSAMKPLHPVSAIIAWAGMLWAKTAMAEYDLNMTPGVTPISKEIYDLHMLALWMVTIIGIIVFAIMIWSIVRHRKSRGAVAAKFHHSTRWEIFWTAIPILILIAFAVPATKTLIVLEETADADMTIKITGYQWKWHYEYLDEGFGFFSSLTQEAEEGRQLRSGQDVAAIDNYLLDVDNPLVIPVNRKVRMLTTAADVIHSWWVPALGWKRDAIPGFINDNWTLVSEPGIYRGQCAELCGKDHAYMPIVLKAVSEQEYGVWVESMRLAQAEAAAGADREWSMAELMERGEQVYSNNCIACHQANGEGLPPAFPALTGSPITTGPAREHIRIVLHGKVGTAMLPFAQQLNDVELAAVITYERNALGNRVGDLVQPADIRASR